jgi:hypothetical protein
MNCSAQTHLHRNESGERDGLEKKGMDSISQLLVIFRQISPSYYIMMQRSVLAKQPRKKSPELATSVSTLSHSSHSSHAKPTTVPYCNFRLGGEICRSSHDG